MIARFGNCAYSYKNKNGKPVFAPSEDGSRIGRVLKVKVERIFKPDPFFYHLKRGGHVAAIHAHRSQRYFARLDFENFFYSIGRNRVTRALQEIGLARAEWYAKWSSIKNPFGKPSYSLPYGFIQSPVLASLVLAQSCVGEFLREVSGQLIVSVYVDDIGMSGTNLQLLERRYRQLKTMVGESSFVINERKSIEPRMAIDLFNCHLVRGRTVVTVERREKFYAVPRTPLSEAAFAEYCAAIERGNNA